MPVCEKCYLYEAIPKTSGVASPASGGGFPASCVQPSERQRWQYTGEDGRSACPLTNSHKTRHSDIIVEPVGNPSEAVNQIVGSSPLYLISSSPLSGFPARVRYVSRYVVAGHVTTRGTARVATLDLLRLSNAVRHPYCSDRCRHAAVLISSTVSHIAFRPTRSSGHHADRCHPGHVDLVSIDP